MKRFLAACLGLVIALGAGASHAQAEPSAVPATDSSKLALAAEFRAEFGFANDAATLSRLFDDPVSDYSYGAPLSPDELKNMKHREALQEATNKLVDYVASKAGDFGGLYFEQQSGDIKLTILRAVGGESTSRDAALALAPTGLSVSTREVQYSTADLEAAQKRLTDRFNDLGLAEVSPNIKDNRLSVVLRPGLDAEPVRMVAAVPVDIAYGEGPQTATCSSPSSCTPYRGGIGIFSPTDSEFCTWGFYGTRGSAAKYIISAGHCSITGHSLSHLGTIFTDAAGVDHDVFDQVSTSNSDSLTAHVAGSPNAVAPFNTIYASSADKSHAITAIRSNSSQTVGTAVCFFGAHTAITLCGTIEAVSLNYNLTRFDGLTVFMVNQVRMSRVVMLGDSGGPVYNGATAFGIVSALDGSHANHLLYSRIGNVISDMVTNVCTSSAC